MRDRETFAPRKRFGQHFLIDTYAVDKIIQVAAPVASDHILEIGPGEGVLTSLLLASGAQLIAVEIDRDLAARLGERFGRYDNFVLRCADVLKFDLHQLPPVAAGWKVVGNLPYNISTPLIMRLLEFTGRFSTLTVMLQREVAERMVAPAGTKAYGRLSVMVQRRCQVNIALELGPDSFRPPPKVDSSVVMLRPYTAVLDGSFEVWFAELVRTAFSTRRKTLANALRPYANGDAFARAEVDPGDRAEQLSVADFVRLAQATRPSHPTSD